MRLLEVKLTTRVIPKAQPRCRPGLLASAFVAYIAAVFTLVFYFALRSEWIWAP